MCDGRPVRCEWCGSMRRRAGAWRVGSPALSSIGDGGSVLKRLSMANLITLTRLVLLFVLVAVTLWAPPTWPLLGVRMVLLCFRLPGRPP